METWMKVAIALSVLLFFGGFAAFFIPTLVSESKPSTIDSLPLSALTCHLPGYQANRARRLQAAAAASKQTNRQRTSGEEDLPPYAKDHSDAELGPAKLPTYSPLEPKQSMEEKEAEKLTNGTRDSSEAPGSTSTRAENNRTWIQPPALPSSGFSQR